MFYHEKFFFFLHEKWNTLVQYYMHATSLDSDNIFPSYFLVYICQQDTQYYQFQRLM